MTLAEAHQKPLLKAMPKYGVSRKQRFSWQDLLSHAEKGGMPVPMFLRSQEQTRDYWKGWFETSIYRDLARCFIQSSGEDPAHGGRGCDASMAASTPNSAAFARMYE
jgi:hypothetical protein